MAWRTPSSPSGSGVVYPANNDDSIITSTARYLLNGDFQDASAGARHLSLTSAAATRFAASTLVPGTQMFQNETTTLPYNGDAAHWQTYKGALTISIPILAYDLNGVADCTLVGISPSVGEGIDSGAEGNNTLVNFGWFRINSAARIGQLRYSYRSNLGAETLRVDSDTAYVNDRGVHYLQWVVVGMTRSADGLTIKFYINGILVATRTAASAPTGGGALSKLYIGSLGAWNIRAPLTYMQSVFIANNIEATADQMRALAVQNLPWLISAA